MTELTKSHFQQLRNITLNRPLKSGEDILVFFINHEKEILENQSKIKELQQEIIFLKELNNGLNYSAEESDRKLKQLKEEIQSLAETEVMTSSIRLLELLGKFK